MPLIKWTPGKVFGNCQFIPLRYSVSKVCACLPTRIVEQDVAEGMSPLGSQYKDCVKISAHLFPGDDVGEYLYLLSDLIITILFCRCW